MAQLPIVSKLHSTECVAVFTSLVQGILHIFSFGGTVRREISQFCLPSFFATSLCLNVTNTKEFVAQLSTVNKLHSTYCVPVFTGLVQGILHIFSFGGTVRREKSQFCLPSFFATSLCLNVINVTNTNEFVAQLSTVSKIHSTDCVAVFTSLVQGILHMSPFGGTVGREKSHFCLPSFSAKFPLLKCHESKGMWGAADQYQLVTQHLLCCCLRSSHQQHFACVVFWCYCR